MAIKYAHVYENGSELCVEPPVTRLRGGKDKMKVVNDTNWDVGWIVPPGPFDATHPYKEKVHKRGGQSHAKRARKVRLATPYQVIQIKRVRGKVQRRKAKGNSDPVIIIDLNE